MPFPQALWKNLWKNGASSQNRPVVIGDSPVCTDVVRTLMTRQDRELEALASVFGLVQTWPHASHRKYHDHEGREIASSSVMTLCQAAHLEK